MLLFKARHIGTGTGPPAPVDNAKKSCKTTSGGFFRRPVLIPQPLPGLPRFLPPRSQSQRRPSSLGRWRWDIRVRSSFCLRDSQRSSECLDWQYGKVCKKALTIFMVLQPVPHGRVVRLAHQRRQGNRLAVSKLSFDAGGHYSREDLSAKWFD